MKPGPARRAFQSLFGVERRETTAKFLYAILITVIVVDTVLILIRLAETQTLNNLTTWVLIGLLVLQFILLFLVRRGQVDLAAFLLVVVSWVLITFLIWSANGVRDVAVYLYILTILVAALLTNWRISILLSLLSIAAIWGFALVEAQGLRTPILDPPLGLARDLTAIFVILVILIYLVVDNVRRSLEAVREGEHKFRKVFQVSPVAISISTLVEGRLVDANEAFFELCGYPRETAIGKTTLELGLWESEAVRASFIGKLQERKSIQNAAHTFVSSSGRQRITYAFYELIELESRPAVLAMLYDITDQRNTQLAMQASEEKYRNFVEQSIEGIWFLAFDQPIPVHLPAAEQVDLIYQRGYIAECNDVLAQMYGYQSSAEIRGARLLDVSKGETLDPTNYQATLKLVRENYRSGNRETKEVNRRGETVYFLNNAVGVIMDDCLVGLWGTQLDITALKSAEEALRRSEVRTRALLTAIPDMIFEFGSDGTILQFIPSANNAPLFPPEQFLGRTIGEVLPALSAQTAFAIDRALESGQVTAFQYELMQDGRNRTFEARLTPLGSDTVLAMVRDVSLQKWIEEEREKLIVELEQKNAELEQFTYTVSHDLKSPLITIRGFLGFIREDSQSGNLTRLDADIQRISAATEKMQALLNDLLELSRVGRLMNKPQEIDFNILVNETLEFLHGRISQSGVAVTVADYLPAVYGDQERLLEVLQNLIDNACKFMGDQPSPCIEIGHQGFENNMPVFYVRDNGVGIAPEFHDNIFGLFNKLDVRSEGTGVGLALVKRIVEFHGGRIWVESGPGQGTTFFFALPGLPSGRPGQ
ncbi:MAG TPA: PAS domain S-box protein [Anaerolineales bacterium]|nr:PAS domain S-box protein [Anaerolineales bacterium]